MRRAAAILFSLAGTAFCILAALGLADAVCATEGCALFKGAAIFGLDLYWIGAAFFLGMSLLLLLQRRRRELSASVMLLLAAGLVVDAFLLAVQAVTVPCLSCLVVAALLGMTVLMLLPESTLLARTAVVWAMIFVAALAGVARDQLTPVPVFGSSDAAVKVFFSPSCFVCQMELQELAGKSHLHKDLALYPVANEPGDLEAIHRFRRVVAESGSLPMAVEALFSAGEGLSLGESLQVVSFRNKVFLARAGARSIPYVLTSSPALLQSASAHQAPSPAVAGDIGAAPDLAPADEGCGYARESSCADEAARNARLYSRNSGQSSPQ
ncbi:hypothetical protein PCS_02429 [Desulfocurvibacter africanus PCS]|uniref:Vitamin K epoxide reductase family protein n=1 Tax=Desulfocurvibacter africanus PCS TaxID=1262666 RepID=M5PRH2_DESAF|nr:hypothetical protein [Desulfocurvibacter africanus]EMG36734.1 hypothetical protein PCS_02429 [Desulfocurvibacter africanus PCS]